MHAALLLLALPALAASPFRPLGWDAARKAAAAEKKLLFADFVTATCAPCKLMDKTTYEDADFTAWLSARAVCVKVDGEKERRLVERLRVGAFPTLLLMDPAGGELDRFDGYHDAAKLRAKLEDAIAGRTELSRLRKEIKAEKDPRKLLRLRFDFARGLAGRGRDEEALAEYLDVYAKAPVEDDPTAGTRGRVPIELFSLGRRLPAAKKAVEAMRDEAAAAFAAAPDRKGAQALHWLNRFAGRSTLEEYDALEAGDPRRAFLGPSVADGLYFAKRYADSLRASGITDHAAHWRERHAAKAGDAKTRGLAVAEAARWADLLARLERQPDARRLLSAALEAGIPRAELEAELAREGREGLLPSAAP